MNMIPEMAAAHKMYMEPPRRVFDTSTPCFPDYGYQSPRSFIQNLSKTLAGSDDPTLVFVMGGPKSGKSHALQDIAGKISRPAGLVLWGNCFNIAKFHNRIPEKGKYGEFGDNHLHCVTDELETLCFEASRENKLTFVETPITAAEINGQLHGRNRAFTALRDIARGQGKFAGLHINKFWVAETAVPDVESRGGAVRGACENKVDEPGEVARTLENSGEFIVTNSGKISPEDQAALVDYIEESANEAATEEITLLVNGLAVELHKVGKLRLNPTSYFWDEDFNGFRFIDPAERARAVPYVFRHILEENFGVSDRVFLGRPRHCERIILDLKPPLTNTARLHYPDIVKYRNK